MSLHGLHVLNTRPAQQSAGLSEALRAAGAVVDELPLIAIRPRDISAAEKRLLMDLDRYDGVFFVSANAVRLGLEAIADYWPQWPHQLPAYAVGRHTAQGLEATAVTVHVPAQADSEGLLELPTLQQLQGQRFLLLRGVGGRELLPQTLRARGATVDIIELYHRALPMDAATRWQALAALPPVVLLTSPDALRHWQTVAGAAATQACWLVVSARMREMAEAAGARVIEAAAADTASVIAALQHFQQHQAHC